MIQSVARQLSALEQRQIVPAMIASQLLTIFRSNIGEEQGISREALFQRLFKHRYDHQSLADYMRWEFARKAMHYCRKYTKCFIVNKQTTETFLYFVVKTQSDAMIYHTRLDASIKAMKYMQGKAMKAATEQWYKESWTMPQQDRHGPLLVKS